MAKKSLPVEKLTAPKSAKAVPVRIVSDVSNGIKDNATQEKKWRAEDDIRTMQRAEEIKKDKARVRAMKEVAKSQMNDLKKIC